MESRVFTEIKDMVSALRLHMDYLGRYTVYILNVLKNAYRAGFKVQMIIAVSLKELTVVTY